MRSNLATLIPALLNIWQSLNLLNCKQGSKAFGNNSGTLGPVIFFSIISVKVKAAG
jgi:hypothetical protein